MKPFKAGSAISHIAKHRATVFCNCCRVVQRGTAKRDMLELDQGLPRSGCVSDPMLF